MANYGRELRIGIDIKRKGKMEKAMEFTEKMKRIQKKVGVVLKKVQEEIKRQADKGRKEIEVWKVGDRIMLNTQDFKERLVKKLVNQYIGPYIIDKVVSTNVIKL